MPLWLTAAASATDETIQKETFGSEMTEMIISVEEMDDILKIVESLEDSSLS